MPWRQQEDQVRVASVMHVRCPERLPQDVFRQVLEQCAELSATVQALPPSAALVELKGALRYHGTDARRLGEVLRVRTLSSAMILQAPQDISGVIQGVARG